MKKAASKTRTRGEVATFGARIRGLEPLDELAEVFATLGSAPRLRLLFLLHYRPDLTVGELAGLLDTSISGVSMHLRRLRAAGLVACKRDGHTVCCALHGESAHVSTLRKFFQTIAQETGCCRP